MFITSTSAPGVYNNIMTYGALHYLTANSFNPAQFFTYMFMHSADNIGHVFFNMFTLFFFGNALERTLGSSRFLFYYISCGVGAALIQEGVWALTWVGHFCDWYGHATGLTATTVHNMLDQTLTTGVGMEVVDMFLNNAMLTIGASGAVYGILLAFALIYPDASMYLFFIPVPIKAKWMVLGFTAVEILLGLSSAAGLADGIAHFAHLGGMIFGFFIIWYWKKRGNLNNNFYS